MKYAIKDFKWIISKYENKKLKLKKELAAEVYFKLGDIYKKTGKVDKAIKMWNKSMKIAPDSEYGKKADDMLVIFEE